MLQSWIVHAINNKYHDLPPLQEINSVNLNNFELIRKDFPRGRVEIMMVWKMISKMTKLTCLNFSGKQHLILNDVIGEDIKIYKLLYGTKKTKKRTSKECELFFLKRFTIESGKKIFF